MVVSNHGQGTAFGEQVRPFFALEIYAPLNYSKLVTIDRPFISNFTEKQNNQLFDGMFL